MDIGEKMKNRRIELGLSLEAVGDIVGVGKSTVRKWENGFIKNMGRDKIVLVAKALRVTPGYLMGWEDAPAVPGLDTMPYTPPRAMVPIIGSVRCGSGGLALEEPLGFEGADVANAEDYFWLRATGDSMEPDVREGDLVLVHKQPQVESGELAVVVVDGEEGMLKRVILKPGAVILQSANPAHPPRVFIGEEAQLVRIAGKAVQSLRKW